MKSRLLFFFILMFTLCTSLAFADIDVDFGSNTLSSGSYINGDLPIDLVTDSTSDYYSFVEINEDLKFWLTMDEINAATDEPIDISGYSNDITLNNYGTNNPYTTGVYGSALSIDGANYETAIINFNEDINVSKGLTMCTWVKQEASALPLQGIMNFGINLGLFRDTTGNYTFRIAQEGGSFTRVGFSATEMTEGEWYHLCGVWDGEQKIYLDGVLKETGTIVTAPEPMSGTTLRLGELYTIRSFPFTGGLDEVIVINRGLSVDEISALKNSTLGGYRETYSSIESLTNFIGYSANSEGEYNLTETRQVIPYPDGIPISFGDETTADRTKTNILNIELDIISSSDYYSFVEKDDDLLLWLHLEDDVLDSSGHQWDTELVNSVNTSYVDGKFGKGLNFSTYYTDPHTFVNIPIDTKNKMEGEITVCTWFNYEENAGNYGGLVSFWRPPEHERSWALTKGLGDNKFMWRMSGDGEYEDSDNNDQITTNEELDPNRWYFLCGVYDGVQKIYLDGIQQDQTSTIISGLYDPALRNITVGVLYDGPSKYYPFQGTIDEVIVIGRGLTSDEIASLYNSTENNYNNEIATGFTSEISFRGLTFNTEGDENETATRVVFPLDTPVEAECQSISEAVYDSFTLGVIAILILVAALIIGVLTFGFGGATEFDMASIGATITLVILSALMFIIGVIVYAKVSGAIC